MRSLVIATALLVVAQPALAQQRTLVKTPADYARAAAKVAPGDTIVLADGVWRDFEMVFSGQGRADKPITLTAQTPGRVVLSGRSNLRLSGAHLVVSNLVFRDGYSPTGEVVSFRRTRQERAVDSRMTGIVIDGFNKPDRQESDNWVALYGQRNRFDHGHLVGKTNLGTTLVVVRDAEQGLRNDHRIDHNFFGPRPNLGSNGGETIRVGTSHDADSDSHTTVESNWFEHCDGEVEIVSNKSGANVYRGNVFFESRGALVLRHGDGVLVEGNIFLGGGKPHTGGVRVINRGHTIRDNYMEGLAGDGFASALSLMYGVPNSPANRYVQVDGVTIQNNTIVDARAIVVGLGMDKERSAPPINTRLASNLIVNTGGGDPVQVVGDASGVILADNLQSPTASPLLRAGVTGGAVTLRRGANGLLTAVDRPDVGAKALTPLRREDTGVAWYGKNQKTAGLDQGKAIAVRPGDETLAVAIGKAAPGDRLELAAGRYTVDKVLVIDRPLTVQGPAEGTATIAFDRPTLFEIEHQGSLRLSRLTITGRDAPDAASNAVIRTRDGSGVAGYTLTIEDSHFIDLDINRAFDVFSAGKGTMADQVTLRGVTADRVSGDVVGADADTDNQGSYNIERLEIASSSFRDIGGAAVNLYRGGTDESTFGPKLVVTGSRFDRVRGGPAGASLRLWGVQAADISDNQFTDSAGLRLVRTIGQPRLAFSGNQMTNTPAPLTDLRPEAGR